MKEKEQKQEIAVGKNIYTELKKNNRAVWGVVVISAIAILAIAVLSFLIYSDSTNKIYTVNNKGDLIPLSLASGRADRIKIIQSSTEYFVRNFYDLDQYDIKNKKERVLWLVGDQPTKVIKDKDAKGYYSNFITINGLVQKAEILPDSWAISNIDDSPIVQFRVLVKRINGQAEEFYNADVRLRMAKVNINYPYNPFGYLITDFVENLSKVQAPDDNFEKKNDSIKAEQANPTITK